MAGRKRSPGAEVRSERTTIRWTTKEKKLLEEAQEKLGITYLVDVPRILALRQLELMGITGEETVAK